MLPNIHTPIGDGFFSILISDQKQAQTSKGATQFQESNPLTIINYSSYTSFQLF